MQVLLAVGAYAPLVFVYLAVAVVCWKQGIAEDPPACMHPVAASMGQTFCAMWILIAPFLLAILVMILGRVGACFFNMGGA